MYQKKNYISPYTKKFQVNTSNSRPAELCWDWLKVESSCFLNFDFLFMSGSCHMQSVENFRRTWNLCFLLIFSWKKAATQIYNFKLLRYLNSKEIKRSGSIRVICILFDLIFFQLKIKRKHIFQVRHQFGHFVKCRIWHEKHITQCLRVFDRVDFLSFSRS